MPLDSVTRKKSVLVLEDQLGEQFMFRETLKDEVDLSFVKSLAQLKTIFSAQKFDMLIADLMVEDGSFFDFLTEFPQIKGYAKSYLVVSSLDDEKILTECLSRGALDYLTKPFNKNELRVKVLRGLANEDSDKINSTPGGHTIPGIIVDFSTLRLTSLASGFSIELTPKEMQVFSQLYRQFGMPIHRRSLEDAIWKGTHVSRKTLDVHVHHLRRKLTGFGLEIQFAGDENFILSRKGMNT